MHEQPELTPEDEQDEGQQRQRDEEEMRGGPAHADPERVEEANEEPVES